MFLQNARQCIRKRNVKHPVITLTDGYGFRFINTLIDPGSTKEMWRSSFPPDTLGITQSVINSNEHQHKYK